MPRTKDIQSTGSFRIALQGSLYEGFWVEGTVSGDDEEGLHISRDRGALGLKVRGLPGAVKKSASTTG